MKLCDEVFGGWRVKGDKLIVHTLLEAVLAFSKFEAKL